MPTVGLTLPWLLVPDLLNGLVRLLLWDHDSQEGMTDSKPGWVAVVALEAIFFDIFVQYWAHGALPLPASSE